MRATWFVIGLALAASLPATAQRPEAVRPRDQLEAEIRRGFARAVRMRVGLSDEQMQRLGPMTQRHAVARRQLLMEERDTRMALQRALRDTAPADTAAVNRMLKRLVEIPKERAQLAENEQKDLATIMTPLQLARFVALQEQVRHQVEQRRRPSLNDPGPPPRRGRPPVSPP